MLWEVMTLGKTPYSTMENMEVVEKVTEEDYRMPPPRGCPQAVYDIMSQCWEEETEDRGSFKEIHERLVVSWRLGGESGGMGCCSGWVWGHSL